jgi:hypothetical protein
VKTYDGADLKGPLRLLRALKENGSGEEVHLTKVEASRVAASVG